MRTSNVLLAVVLASVLPGLGLQVEAQSGDPHSPPRQHGRFAGLDRDGDGYISRSEWRGSRQSFAVNDRNGDGVLSPDEIEVPEETRFRRLDANNDRVLDWNEWYDDWQSFNEVDRNGDMTVTLGEFRAVEEAAAAANRLPRGLDRDGDNRISRREWRGSSSEFRDRDSDGDGYLTPDEMPAATSGGLDEFEDIDRNADGVITWTEWNGDPAGFAQLDRNRDGRLNRAEYVAGAWPSGRDSAMWDAAYEAGHRRGLRDGRQAGREDRDRNRGWSLEERLELDTADAGYIDSYGPIEGYKAGYREAFRTGYRQGYGR